jgi:hypothetical protein
MRGNTHAGVKYFENAGSKAVAGMTAQGEARGHGLKITCNAVAAASGGVAITTTGITARNAATKTQCDPHQPDADITPILTRCCTDV